MQQNILSLTRLARFLHFPFSFYSSALLFPVLCTHRCDNGPEIMQNSIFFNAKKELSAIKTSHPACEQMSSLFISPQKKQEEEFWAPTEDAAGQMWGGGRDASLRKYRSMQFSGSLCGQQRKKHAGWDSDWRIASFTAWIFEGLTIVTFS